MLHGENGSYSRRSKVGCLSSASAVRDCCLCACRQTNHILFNIIRKNCHMEDFCTHSPHTSTNCLRAFSTALFFCPLRSIGKSYTRRVKTAKRKKKRMQKAALGGRNRPTKAAERVRIHYVIIISTVARSGANALGERKNPDVIWVFRVHILFGAPCWLVDSV